MTRQIIALAGISGVGKSYLLSELGREMPMQVFQASALIKAAREAAEKNVIALDQLRARDLDENQRLLISGFSQAVQASPPLVLFDCHTLIERGDELVRIEPEVFKGIGIARMAFLTEEPSIVLQRRSGDTTRKRPLVSIERLRAIQDEALNQARHICDALGVSLSIYISSTDKKALSEMLRGEAKG